WRGLRAARPPPHQWRAAGHATPCSCDSSCTLPAPGTSPWRARSISGIGTLRPWCVRAPRACGRPPWPSPSASTSTPSSWTASAGGATRVPAGRVIEAVRALAARVAGATDAVRAGGLESPKADVVEGGADGLSAGLSAGHVSALVRASRAVYDPALVLRVAATLAALGVPPKQAVQLVEGMIKDGRSS